MNFKQWCEVFAKYTLAFVRNQTVNKTGQKFDKQTQLLPGYIVCSFRFDAQSVLRSLWHTHAVAAATGWQLTCKPKPEPLNDVLVKSAPFCNQSFFQVVDVTDPATVDSLLQNAPDSV